MIVENHGGLSSNPEWLEGVFKKVALPNCGSLPDFGNFKEYDRYAATERLMPYAKGSAPRATISMPRATKPSTDYMRMIPIVLRSGYNGFIGIEYEGSELSPDEGVLATKHLLIRARDAWMAKA